jgi:hypothetical protein
MKKLILVLAAWGRPGGGGPGRKTQRLRVAGTHAGSHVQLRPLVSDVLDLCGSYGCPLQAVALGHNHTGARADRAERVAGRRARATDRPHLIG